MSLFCFVPYRGVGVDEIIHYLWQNLLFDTKKNNEHRGPTFYNWEIFMDWPATLGGGGGVCHIR